MVGLLPNPDIAERQVLPKHRQQAVPPMTVYYCRHTPLVPTALVETEQEGLRGDCSKAVLVRPAVVPKDLMS